MRRLWPVLIGAALAAACDGGKLQTVTAPSPVTPTTATPTPATVAIQGVLTSVNGSGPISGVTVTTGNATAITDGAGSFSLTSPATASASISAIGGGIVPRTVTASFIGSRRIDFNAIALGSGFDLAFYRQFARDGYESPTALQPLRHWTEAPRFYLKTADEAGHPIDGATLDTIATTLVDGVGAWTGGRFGLAALERGGNTREGQPGWITVKFPYPTEMNVCGRAQVGGDWIALSYASACSCGGYRVAPRTVNHELGHVLGFWHTSDRADLMWGGQWTDCNQAASAREHYHAAIAYARPNGNTDPDADPPSATILTAATRIVQ